ncbi:MAG: MBOAT family protein [Bacteroides sp.]|nr:MBOAT family protein [Bacteroides sp.]MCM1085718.1 MBOAT family protein [Bacteroides sp.]
MLFNSLAFTLFFPFVFCLYWLLRRSVKAQNLFVVIASYVFYGWWDWRFLLLIACTTVCSFTSGLLMDRCREKIGMPRFVCIANIVLNLGILFLFKYFNFFAESFTSLLTAFGLQAHPPTLSLILPVGISFYTFQAIGYTIDVYRGKIPAARDGIAFFAFISFFPQLVAGPIERASRLYPQFTRERTFDYQRAVSGCRLILWGFFKKVVIADGAAEIVNVVFGNASAYNSATHWLAAILFTFQIYGDFSGYSDIAVGTARLLGIDLMKNFDKPYLSRSVPEFWRRWHISLTSWFRDYIYFPLGGSRCSKAKSVRNTMIVFLVSGLWHGANWTFLVWGLYHAVFFLPRLLTGKKIEEKFRFPWISVVVTFVIVTVGWVIFRAENLTSAWQFIQGMFCGEWELPVWDGISRMRLLKTLLAISLLMFAEYMVDTKVVVLMHRSWRTALRWGAYLIIALWIFLSFEESQVFFYFQF